ncbi:hypothetical protein SDC9_173323 [bioreactor metagenome]|uniref:Uncharacterized protein n=1 Tax=bioreactor metagenome TaxID=1076179 RepID=A0A645GJ32_9ZZZZ
MKVTKVLFFFRGSFFKYCVLRLLRVKQVEDQAELFLSQLILVSVNAYPCQPTFKFILRVVVVKFLMGLQPGLLVQIIGIIRVLAQCPT